MEAVHFSVLVAPRTTCQYYFFFANQHVSITSELG
jgi:hypothetical protein